MGRKTNVVADILVNINRSKILAWASQITHQSQPVVILRNEAAKGWETQLNSSGGAVKLINFAGIKWN